MKLTDLLAGHWHELKCTGGGEPNAWEKRWVLQVRGPVQSPLAQVLRSQVLAPWSVLAVLLCHVWHMVPTFLYWATKLLTPRLYYCIASHSAEALGTTRTTHFRVTGVNWAGGWRPIALLMGCMAC